MKKKLDILYEDKYLLAVNKSSGLLTISTENEVENTLFHEVYTYVKQKHKGNKVFIVHRLDKDTSGIVLFAKDEKIKNSLQENWNEDNIIRKYIAIVEGLVDENGTVKSYLKETKTLLVYSTNNQKEGKLAITNYKVVKQNFNTTLLEIHILTGRKNQIRVHMKDIDHIIVGDKKYGSKIKGKRLFLHAYLLEFKHPITKEKIKIETDIPDDFIKFMGLK